MADELVTWNHICFSSQIEHIAKSVGAPTDEEINSITLPNIPGIIQYVKVTLNIVSLNADNDLDIKLEGIQTIQVKEFVSGTWTTGLTLPDNALETKVSGAGSFNIGGGVDLSSEVSAFNKLYQVRWANLDFEGDDVHLSVNVDLDIWFTLDSGVEAKIDVAQADLDILTGIDGSTLATLQPNYAPNKVVPDAAGVSPTAVEIRQEMDSNSSRLDADISSRAPANEYDTEMSRITANVATEAKQNIIDGIVDDIKQSIIVGSGTVTLLGSQTVFQTDLTDADDFWNDLQILMISGSNAGQVRRISDFANTNGQITVDTGFKNNVALNDTFILIGRFTSAASALTPASISTAVWSETLPGSFTGSMAGKILSEIKTWASAIFNKLPSKSYLSGTADADGGMDTEDKADIESECGDALTAFDTNGVASKNQLDTAETNIIAEIDVNEGKIDNLDADLIAHDSAIKGLIGVPAVDVSVDIANLDADLVTHDGDIKTLIGTPSPDLVTDIQTAESNIRGADADDLKNLSDQMDSLSAQVGQIQNNVFFSTTVLPSYERPATGSSIIKIIAQVFDATGNPEDPDSDQLYIKLDGSVTGALIAQTLMTKDSVGVYSYQYTIQSTDNLENWEFEFYYKEATVDKYHYRNSKLQDYGDDLDDIRNKVNANYVKLDAVISSPTVPAQIATHDTDIKGDISDHDTDIKAAISTHDTDIKGDISTHDTDMKALPRIEACPDMMYVPTGRTQINIEDGISDADVEIPVKIADNLLTTGMVKIDDEYIIYDGITDSKLQVIERGAYSTVAAAHANNIIVTQSIVFPVRLVVFDNAGNMKNADTPPTLEIEDWKGTQELAPTAMTVIGTGIYGYEYIIDYGEVPENKIFKFSATVDAKTRELRHEVVIIDQPASSAELIQYLGGGNGDFVVDQDGWYDLDGIKTLWTDEMKGYAKDADTGAPLDDAYVTAYLYENDETKYNGRPPGQARTRVNGTWLMFLDAHEYTFVIEKDGFRVVGGGIQNRTVG